MRFQEYTLVMYIILVFDSYSEARRKILLMKELNIYNILSSEIYVLCYFYYNN